MYCWCSKWLFLQHFVPEITIVLKKIFVTFLYLQAVDIRQIYDKFPEKKGGLKELYDKGPQPVFFLVKFWVSYVIS